MQFMENLKETSSKTSNFDNSSTKLLHTPVLVKEVLENLNIKPNGIYVDATFGCGGHTKAILEAEKTCRVIALDWDLSTIEQNGPIFKEIYGDRIQMIWGNFSHLYRLLKKEKIKSVDGILADFGTSQLQINQTDGLSFQKDSPLDMRMSKAHNYYNAKFVVNRYSERDLIKILFEFGEEIHAKKIARTIVKERQNQEIDTTLQLASLIEKVVPINSKNYRIHPATKTFQALRIYVNKELENIELFLPATLHFLNNEGRLACISFHSLEDRIVKNFIKENSAKLLNLTPKPITASDEEIEQNRSSRSAKLRVAQKIIF
ncbi:TPA: 16S rRNA (cytosine(1402)-N(4))-methyltransferase [Candidatus Dependentiae bacterium]|nr:MAG: Ribosomal RNA small subunit methyltransferase H [candidate division TM6 bacterium GW2011_GWE2_31_21]KKP53568.1 MAG: Ribosomal RNA small subunit methyltransferase H [candidate division TM6 bacterium GW2011_GWF2_33_332]HBS48191.1 16S rRNA (cytosine(1402)-N(4))-methyltransferase [Candidatus Dependentiae bacterium]HBZ73617.1 16S rRNA (cytosine(1402)-N(4))-methyltransferase [Candidatus Dependentiae bacterium]